MRLKVNDLWQVGQPLPRRAVLHGIARRCGALWDEDDLPSRVRIGYNPRLRTTLGRARLEDRVVELNPRLLSEHPDELVPTLVHELAHVVVYMRFGRVAPHGAHFRVLMSAAGLSAKATHDLPVAHLRRRRQRYLYVHRCDHCGQQFVARSVKRGYCCAACGPEMHWEIWRVPNNEQGRTIVKEVLSQTPAEA